MFPIKAILITLQVVTIYNIVWPRCNTHLTLGRLATVCKLCSPVSAHISPWKKAIWIPAAALPGIWKRYGETIAACAEWRSITIETLCASDFVFESRYSRVYFIEECVLYLLLVVVSIVSIVFLPPASCKEESRRDDQEIYAIRTYGLKSNWAIAVRASVHGV